MSKMMEDMRKEAAAIAVREKSIETARILLSMKKLSYDEIALSSGLTVEEVAALDEKKSA